MSGTIATRGGPPPRVGERHERSVAPALESSLPPRRRSNGFAFGQARRGHFLVEGMGRGQLFTQNGPPYVLVRTADTFVFVDTGDQARTRRLYEDLIAATSHR